MRLSGGGHLSFCLNVFPGETWDDLLRHLQGPCLELKRRVSPDAPFGLGLRLSEAMIARPAEDFRMLRLWLAKHGLYAFTANIFPQGDFHSPPVKARVYHPDWSRPERLAYTLAAAERLALLLPEDCESGSLSTVPVTYGPQSSPEHRRLLLAAAQGLAELSARCGKTLVLALEPEPDCLLQTSAEAIDFIQSLQLSAVQARHLGVCLDTCHHSLRFESPLTALQAYGQAGVTVAKIQISAALELQATCAADRARLLPFAESTWLHQTSVRSGSGELLCYPDLPQALQQAPDGLWRTHFHVPLDFAGAGPLCSTAHELTSGFFALARRLCPHFETETYTFNVLPEPRPPLLDSLGAELRLARGWLEAAAQP